MALTGRTDGIWENSSCHCGSRRDWSICSPGIIYNLVVVLWLSLYSTICMAIIFEHFVQGTDLSFILIEYKIYLYFSCSYPYTEFFVSVLLLCIYTVYLMKVRSNSSKSLHIWIVGFHLIIFHFVLYSSC